MVHTTLLNSRTMSLWLGIMMLVGMLGMTHNASAIPLVIQEEYSMDLALFEGFNAANNTKEQDRTVLIVRFGNGEITHIEAPPDMELDFASPTDFFVSLNARALVQFYST